MSEVKLEKNVLEFIDKCSEEVGKWKTEDFSWDMLSDLNSAESPIEQILYCALKTIQILNRIDEQKPILIDDTEYIEGLGIFFQPEFNRYRCDFLLEYGVVSGGMYKIHRELIVECDSQIFHERTEKERRYEKARDRYLTTQGYKVFHYTGSEIVKKPLEVAIQILSYLTGMDYDDFIKDSSYE